MLKRINKKGFTLVELVVVIAIMGILGAVSVPKLTNLRYEAKVKAEGATAISISNAARIQEINTGKPVEALKEESGKEELKAEYMTLPTNPTYSIEDGGDKPYKVFWTTAADGTFKDQNFEYTEGTEFNHTKGTK